ncbi:MAG: zinc ribbon domain-containing protein [Novosphingobium sp.]|nr:zinc ribbon domain-containing protein [Novosphingobium sp.]
MICKSCKADVAHGAKFCPECGEKFTVEPPPCPACGAANLSASKFCAECGASQQLAGVVPVPPDIVAPPIVTAPPPVMIASAPEPEPLVVNAAEKKSADASVTDIGTEEFWGPDPKYGKIPWGEFAFLTFASVLTVISIFGNGAYMTNALGGMAVVFTILRIIEQFSLKPTKLYYSITPLGLSYCSATGSMDAVAWSEMKHLERVDDIGPQLKLTWMGVRGNDSVFKWLDRLLTKLTGKVHRGGVPVEENSKIERVIVLDGRMMSSRKVGFGDRFQALFQQVATLIDSDAPGSQ